MEKPGRVLVSYYLNLALQLGGIIVLLLFMIASAGLNILQNQEIEAMKKNLGAAERDVSSKAARITTLEKEKEGLQANIVLMREENSRLQSNLSEISLRLDRLEARIKYHMDARGKSCYGDSETCLEELVTVTEPVKPTEPDCSPVQDNTCPQKCAPATDYDCCTANGFRWVSGKGCYSR